MWWSKDEKKSNATIQAREEDLYHDKSNSSQPSLSSNSATEVGSTGEVTTQRKLYNRHLQLIAIGGSIGTGLFVTIGTTGLTVGGPLGLLMAYCLSTLLILLLTSATGEMVSYMPVDSPFLNMAGRVIDPAFEAAASVNFWVMQSLYIPFEITAVN
ncbi:hypothetical protein G210_1185, partial [Candida maltosa Xu316]